MCAKLRNVYREVMVESANLLVYFGDELGQKLISPTLSVVKGAAAAPVNIGNLAVIVLLMIIARLSSVCLSVCLSAQVFIHCTHLCFIFSQLCKSLHYTPLVGRLCST